MSSLALRAYRNYRWYSSPERMRMRSTVLSWIHERGAGGVLLEVGGGTSALRPLIQRRFPEIQYISSDISPTDATDVALDAACLPVRDGSIDLVVALEVLEHLPHPRTMLVEASRALSDGGVLVLTTPFMFGVHDYRDYFRFTPLGLETLLEGTDLTLTEVGLRGGAFVSAMGLLKSVLRNRILGGPTGWRAHRRRKKVLWGIVLILEMPWVPFMWLAMCIDRIADRNSHSPPGFMFRCVKGAQA